MVHAAVHAPSPTKTKKGAEVVKNVIAAAPKSALTPTASKMKATAAVAAASAMKVAKALERKANITAADIKAADDAAADALASELKGEGNPITSIVAVGEDLPKSEAEEEGKVLTAVGAETKDKGKGRGKGTGNAKAKGGVSKAAKVLETTPAKKAKTTNPKSTAKEAKKAIPKSKAKEAKNKSAQQAPPAKKNDDGFDIGKNGEELRDSKKTKKFLEILHSGLMPANIRDIFEGAKAKRGSSMRQEETKIINRFLRKKDGTWETVPDSPYFDLRRQYEKKGYQDEYHEGVCWEEAKTKCAGKESLREGVAALRIKRSGSQDWPNSFYHFPRTKIGGVESFAHQSASMVKHAISDEGMQSFALALEAMIPVPGAVLSAFNGNAPGSLSLASAAGTAKDDVVISIMKRSS